MCLPPRRACRHVRALTRPGKFLTTLPLLLLLLIAFSGHARAATCSILNPQYQFQTRFGYVITDRIQWSVSADWDTPGLTEIDELHIFAKYYDSTGAEITTGRYDAVVTRNINSDPPMLQTTTSFYNGVIDSGAHKPANAVTCIYRYYVVASVSDATTTYASDRWDSGSYTVNY